MGRRINPGKYTERPKPRLHVWQRFLDKIDECPKTKCWIWTAHKDHNGYGQFSVGGKTWWAHRWAYAAFVDAIAEGMDIDHICRCPSCVNPEHLRQKTIAENRGRVEAVYD